MGRGGEGGVYDMQFLFLYFSIRLIQISRMFSVFGVRCSVFGFRFFWGFGMLGLGSWVLGLGFWVSVSFCIHIRIEGLT